MNDSEQKGRGHAFAGEKVASMKRRSEQHDYTARRMYLITMEVEGRRPLLGRLVGSVEAADAAGMAPRIEVTALGQAVKEAWEAIPRYYPQVGVVACQVMPDHFHGILFVREQLGVHLGQVIKGFKTGCNKAYRSMFAATVSQHTGNGMTTGGREERAVDRGLLWAKGYNDRILFSYDQLQRWVDYLWDNPRRLALKRAHPDLFRIRRDVTVGPYTFAAMGNIFLLRAPVRVQVQCSRSLTEQQIAERTAFYLQAARQGAVLVSPAISKGEKAVMRAAFEAGHPLIILQENGFAPLAKPGGRRFDACAAGRLLMLAPWAHHNEQRTIRRSECLTLNEMAAAVCG